MEYDTVSRPQEEQPETRDVIKKVVLVGGQVAGKTAVIKRYVDDSFSDKYAKTIGVTVSKKSQKWNNLDVGLMVWDISGEIFLKHPGLFDCYTSGAKGIMLVYDSQCPWANHYANFDATLCKLGKMPVAVVASKVDIGVKEEFERMVQERAEAIGTKPFFTSARTGEGISEAFEHLTREIMGRTGIIGRRNVP